MSDDPLDKQVSVALELSEAGFKAGTTSRAAAAIDRLVGSAIDWVSVRLERGPKLRRAKDDADVAFFKGDGCERS
jgi:hypothetical protein